MKPIEDLQLVAVCTPEDFQGSLKPVLAIPLTPNMTVQDFQDVVRDTVENHCFQEAWWWPDEHYEELISMVNARFAGYLVAKSKMMAESAEDEKTYACIRVITPAIPCNIPF